LQLHLNHLYFLFFGMDYHPALLLLSVTV